MTVTCARAVDVMRRPAVLIMNTVLTFTHVYSAAVQRMAHNDSPLVECERICDPEVDGEAQCYGYNTPVPTRLLVYASIGLIVALFSIACNSLLFYALASKRAHRHSSFIYLILIAMADVFICVGYILCIFVDKIDTYINSQWIYRVWASRRCGITVPHLPRWLRCLTRSGRSRRP